jgi:hypothetical protein
VKRCIVLVIAAASGRGTKCYDASGAEGILPVIVDSVDRAVSLLRQFRVDGIVFQPREAGEVDALYTTLAEVAPDMPVVLYRELPSPRVLASVMRRVLARSGLQMAPDASAESRTGFGRDRTRP